MTLSINCPTCGTCLKTDESASAAIKACPYCGAGVPISLARGARALEQGETAVHIGSAVEIVDADLADSPPAPPPPVPSQKPFESTVGPAPATSAPATQAPDIPTPPTPAPDIPAPALSRRQTWQRAAILASPLAAVLVLSLVGIFVKRVVAPDGRNPANTASQSVTPGASSFGDRDEPAISAAPAPSHQSPTISPTPAYSPSPAPYTAPPVYAAPAPNALTSQQRARRVYLEQAIPQLQASIEADNKEIQLNSLGTSLFRGVGKGMEQAGRNSDKPADPILGSIGRALGDYVANEGDKKRAAIQARMNANQQTLLQYQAELNLLNAAASASN